MCHCVTVNSKGLALRAATQATSADLAPDVWSGYRLDDQRSMARFKEEVNSRPMFHLLLTVGYHRKRLGHFTCHPA